MERRRSCVAAPIRAWSRSSTRTPTCQRRQPMRDGDARRGPRVERDAVRRRSRPAGPLRLPGGARRPRPAAACRRFVQEVFKLGVLSLIIISVCGLAVGMVLSLQGYNTLVRFGAEQSLGAVVGLSLIRELGPVLTALLATGRAGSA